MRAASKEEAMQHALAMWNTKQNSSTSKPCSLYRFCKEEGLTYSTLRDRLMGKCSMAEFNRKKQLLSNTTEAEIVKHLLAMADRALPLTHHELCDLVNEILNSQGHVERI
jgi:hypothetical protein